MRAFNSFGLAPGIAASLVAAACIAGLQNGKASANLITNGNFTANAVDFGFPGQQGFSAGPTGTNPDIADWSFAPINPPANLGLNGNTVSYASTVTAPVSTAGVGDWAFIIYNGTELYQSVATTAGVQYTLAFEGAGANTGSGGYQMSATAYDGSLTGTVVGSLTKTMSSLAFNSYSLNFTAKSSATVIAFENVSTQAFARPIVDVANVSVDPTPEPTEILPLAAGLAAIGLIRARLRRRGHGA